LQGSLSRTRGLAVALHGGSGCGGSVGQGEVCEIAAQDLAIAKDQCLLTPASPLHPDSTEFSREFWDQGTEASGSPNRRDQGEGTSEKIVKFLQGW
jgi:hypothetical protein